MAVIFFAKGSLIKSAKRGKKDLKKKEGGSHVKGGKGNLLYREKKGKLLPFLFNPAEEGEATLSRECSEEGRVKGRLFHAFLKKVRECRGGETTPKRKGVRGKKRRCDISFTTTPADRGLNLEGWKGKKKDGDEI